MEDNYTPSYLHLYIIVVFLCSFYTYPNEIEPKRLKLSVGKSQIIKIETLDDLHLSRRGIIDVTFISPQKWRITGHKEGFVILSYTNDENSRYQQIFVDVIKATNDKSKVFPYWICARPEINCNNHSKTLTGKTNNIQLFYAAKRFCKKNNKCFFEITLDHKGRQLLKNQLDEVLSSRYLVEVKDSGFIKISMGCNDHEASYTKLSRTIKNIIQQMQLDDHVIATCMHLHAPKQFQLKATTVLMEQSIAKDLGFEAFLSGKVSYPLNITLSTFESKLRTQMKNHKLKIIGEPSLKLTSGVPAQAQAGGEFPFTQRKQNNHSHQWLHTDAWKEYGMDLEVTVYEIKSSLVQIKYQLILKIPSGKNGQKKLQSNRLQSTIHMKTGEATVVGGINYITNVKRQQTIPVLKDVPIIAPLFHLFLYEQANMNMYLIFEITRQN